MTAAKPKKRGRPPLLPPLSPTDRTGLWRQQLYAARGREVRAYLGPLAWEALQKLAPKGERGPFIEGLILQAWRNAKD